MTPGPQAAAAASADFAIGEAASRAARTRERATVGRSGVLPVLRKPHFDDGECTEYHRRIDIAHMGNAKSLAVQLAKAAAEHNATFGFAVIAQATWIERRLH